MSLFFPIEVIAKMNELLEVANQQKVCSTAEGPYVFVRTAHGCLYQTD